MVRRKNEVAEPPKTVLEGVEDLAIRASDEVKLIQSDIENVKWERQRLAEREDELTVKLDKAMILSTNLAALFSREDVR